MVILTVLHNTVLLQGTWETELRSTLVPLSESRPEVLNFSVAAGKVFFRGEGVDGGEGQEAGDQLDDPEGPFVGAVPNIPYEERQAADGEATVGFDFSASSPRMFSPRMSELAATEVLFPGGVFFALKVGFYSLEGCSSWHNPSSHNPSSAKLGVFLHIEVSVSRSAYRFAIGVRRCTLWSHKYMF